MANSNEILVYVSELNNRIHFLFRHVFFKMMGIRPTFTNDKEAFVQCTSPKINYSANKLGKELYIKPQGLLYQKGVKRISVKVDYYKGLPVLFKNGEESDFHFDIFSAIFYMLTRYEEYMPFSPDRYDRFQPHESIAAENGFIDEPIVEKWVELFKDFLKTKFSDFEYSQHQFCYIPTIDVDSAYAYRHKGVFLGTGLFIRDIFKGRFTEFFHRFMVILHFSSDPFDNFDFLKESFKENCVKPVFFFLSGKRGTYDKNISIRNKAMQNVVRHSAKFADIGLHPSYGSNKSTALLEKEKENLEMAYGHPISKSRQHYIKINLPKTYQNLYKFGISEDYSMGYAVATGFRAGTCTPYNFYDITKDKETDLKIYPFQAMDATFRTYLKQTPAEAEKKILELRDKVKKVNGVFILVWHNNTFAPTKEGNEWRRIFLELLSS